MIKEPDKRGFMVKCDSKNEIKKQLWGCGRLRTSFG